MQRQAYYLKAGNLERLQLREESLPDPASGEVQVTVHAAGLNFADIFAIWGLYGATPEGDFVPGLEYAGTINKVGAGVEGLREGDRIMGVTRFGGYASHLNIDHRYVIPLPADWSFNEGAAFLVQVLTAYYGMVTLGRLKKGESVLIHSAAGGVGIQAGRIARAFDCFTIGTVGNAGKVEFLESEGYHRAIVRQNATFEAELEKALGNRDLNLIMESIGGKIFRIGFERLAPQGRHIVYGSARYASVGNRPNYLRLLWLFLTRPRIDPQKLPEQNKSIMGFNLIWIYHQVELMHQLLGEIDALQLPAPHVGHAFPFEEAIPAIRLFQTGRTIGKVVLTNAQA